MPEALQVQIHAAAATAFSKGFGEASLVASMVAAIAGALAFTLVRAADTALARSGNAEATHRWAAASMGNAKDNCETY